MVVVVEDCLWGVLMGQLCQIAVVRVRGRAGGSGVNTGKNSAAVVFGGELALEGVEYGLCSLVDMAEFPVPGLFVFTVGMDQAGVELFGDEGVKPCSSESFITDDHLPGADQMPPLDEISL